MKFKLNLRPCKVLFSIVLFSSLQLCVAFAQMGKTANASPSDLHSERWPKHTVRILVGFPAGSTPDMIARTIAEPLSKSLGQAVIVENHVGVSGNLAAQLVAHAQDDHTLGLMINGNLTTAKLLYPSLDFDPLKDFSLISLIADSPLVLVAPANLPSGRLSWQQLKHRATTGITAQWVQAPWHTLQWRLLKHLTQDSCPSTSPTPAIQP